MPRARLLYTISKCQDFNNTKGKGEKKREKERKRERIREKKERKREGKEREKERGKKRKKIDVADDGLWLACRIYTRFYKHQRKYFLFVHKS